jgi:hypothetical protein
MGVRPDRERELEALRIGPAAENERRVMVVRRRRRARGQVLLDWSRAGHHEFSSVSSSFLAPFLLAGAGWFWWYFEFELKMDCCFVVVMLTVAERSFEVVWAMAVRRM